MNLLRIQQLVLVVDSLKIHSPACLYERFTPAEARRIARKLAWHYTPEHGSWLNIAECELSVLERQCLARRMPDVESLKREGRRGSCGVIKPPSPSLGASPPPTHGSS